MSTPMKKEELKQILIEQYGYNSEELNDKTNAVLQGMINKEIKDAEVLKEEESRQTRQVRTPVIGENDIVTIMSGQIGGVIYREPNSMKVWEFEEFGQQDEMTFSELKRMNNRYPAFLREGYIIVLDKDVQKELKLTQIYENIVTPENIDSIFKMDVEKLEKFIDNLPSGMKHAVANKAMELYQNDELDSTKVRKMIEKKFGFSLEDNAPLNDLVVAVK